MYQNCISICICICILDTICMLDFLYSGYNLTDKIICVKTIFQSVSVSVSWIQSVWWISSILDIICSGGSTYKSFGHMPPPNRIKFFQFYICFHRKAPVLEVDAPPMGVGTPQQEILDLPLI